MPNSRQEIRVNEDQTKFTITVDGTDRVLKAPEYDLVYLARSMRSAVDTVIVYADGSEESVGEYLRKTNLECELSTRKSANAALIENLSDNIYDAKVGVTNLNLDTITKALEGGTLQEGVYRQLNRNVIVTKQGVFILKYSGYSSSERSACIHYAKERLGLDLDHLGSLPQIPYWDINKVEMTEADLVEYRAILSGIDV